MRTFYLTLFWICNLGNVIQLLVLATAGWLIFSGNYASFELTVVVFVTEVVPWMQWLETLVVTLFGEFGRMILALPIVIITPLKFIAGSLIGWWAYTTAKNLPGDPAYT